MVGLWGMMGSSWGELVRIYAWLVRNGLFEGKKSCKDSGDARKDLPDFVEECESSRYVYLRVVIILLASLMVGWNGGFLSSAVFYIFLLWPVVPAYTWFAVISVVIFCHALSIVASCHLFRGLPTLLLIVRLGCKSADSNVAWYEGSFASLSPARSTCPGSVFFLLLIV